MLYPTSPGVSPFRRLPVIVAVPVDECLQFGCSVDLLKNGNVCWCFWCNHAVVNLLLLGMVVVKLWLMVLNVGGVVIVFVVRFTCGEHRSGFGTARRRRPGCICCPGRPAGGGRGFAAR